MMEVVESLYGTGKIWVQIVDHPTLRQTGTKYCFRYELNDDVIDWLLDRYPTVRHQWDHTIGSYTIEFKCVSHAIDFRLRWA